MRLTTKTLHNILFENKGEIYEYNGNIYHRRYDMPITRFMQARLGKDIEIVIDSRDEFGCVWQPWMIERIHDK